MTSPTGPVAHDGPVHPIHAGPGHVLVVDDSRMNRMTLIRLLDRLGHETTEASDGREALDLLAAGAPVDLVLLDLVMPVVDGFETLATMKADARLAEIPVIVVSGLDDLDSRSTAGLIRNRPHANVATATTRAASQASP